MECPEVKKILASFLSGELDEPQSDEVRQHLIHCEGCQKELEAYKETWGLLGIWEEEEPAPGYISRFWERSASERPWWQGAVEFLRPIVTPRRVVPAVGMVSLLVIVGFFTFRITQARRTEKLLTALNTEQVEFIENLGMTENMQFLEQMDMLEKMDVLDDVSPGDHLPKGKNA